MKVAVPDEMQVRAEHLAEAGMTPLFFARGDRLLGMIAVADALKEDSIAAVRDLHDLGLRVLMLTGDNERTACAIGAEAGVDDIVAGVLPDGKERVVADLCHTSCTAMVGDGINDAPALARAHTGIAIGAGADVAVDAADVVLMKSRLSDVAVAIRLSRATLGNIRQNLFWAFFYNMAGIPLAAGLFWPFFGWELSPMFAAAAMSLSSFCVVTNALRLNFFRPRALAGARGTGTSPEVTFTVSGGPDSDSPKKSKEQKMKKVLKIKGMMCGHCEEHMKDALLKVDGVVSATADHDAGEAVIDLSHDVSEETLRQVVIGAGYEYEGLK